MANDVRITVSVNDNASAPLRKVGQETDKLGTSAVGTGASMLSMGLAITAVTATVGVVVSALASAVAMSAELARVNAQTGAVLRSTGGISGMTAEAVRGLASSLETLTGVDEIAIQSAENMLLTFTNIGATTMPAATQAVLDMAVAMNGGLIPSEQELAKTSIQVGRALQDPIDGVTALRRVGVQLSDEQQELVKHLVATGRGAEAQALILKELQVEFGGSAEAASKARGGVDQARDAFEDAQRALGDRLIPRLKDAQRGMYEFGASVVENMEGPLNGALNVIDNVSNALSRLATLAKTPIKFEISGIDVDTTLGGIAKKIGSAAAAALFPLTAAALNALTSASAAKDMFVDPLASERDSLLPNGAANLLNGANAFDQPNDRSGAKAVVPAYITALQNQIQAAYVQGGMKQVEVVRRSQEDMMAAVDTAAAKMSIDLGITLPDATQLMFDRMLAQQTALAAAQEAIANANMLAQIDAYLKGGQAAVDIVKLQQADTAVEISKMANNISEAFGITMPQALALATKAAGATASAMLEMGKQAVSLAQQLFKTTGNTAQQGAMGALAFAVTARDAAANAGNLGALPALDAAVATALANANAPKMANGGIVRARPGGTMALLGEGGRDEAVIPLGSGGMGGTVNVYLSGVITDPVATGRAVAAALNTASRTTGPLLLSGTVQ